LDIRKIKEAGLRDVLVNYMELNSYKHLLKYFLACEYMDSLNLLFPQRRPLDPSVEGPQNRDKIQELEKVHTCIGELSFKKEPAGKVRVFAMVDVWTQSVLKPLHDALFSFLQSLPCDATFDQSLAVTRCFEKSKLYNCSYGYDLSAATDRLPIFIQEKLLSVWLSPEIASLWKTLLVGRAYACPANELYGIAATRIKYAVGQPMGALSS